MAGHAEPGSGRRDALTRRPREVSGRSRGRSPYAAAGSATWPRGSRACEPAAARGERGTSPRRTWPRPSGTPSSRAWRRAAAAGEKSRRAAPALPKMRMKAGRPAGRGKGTPGRRSASAGAGAPFPASAGAGRGECASASAAAPSSTRRRARGTAPAARARGPSRGEPRGPPPCAILYTPGTARCTTCTTCMRS